MKHFIFILFCAIIFSSCNPDLKPYRNSTVSPKKLIPETTISVYNWLGDSNRIPDIKPVEYEIDYYGVPYGVRVADDQFPKVFYGLNFFGELGWWLRYYCPIENVGVTTNNFYSPHLPYPGNDKYSGADFVFKSPVNNPDFLYRVIFQNGLPVTSPSANYKLSWDGGDRDYTYNYNPGMDSKAFLYYYPYGDTSVLHAGRFDTYFNDVKLPDDPSGKFLLSVTVNQENYITHQRLVIECDTCYKNNIVTLPVRIEGTNVWIDTSAISVNKPAPVSSLTDSVTGHGKNQAVILHWICPYHDTQGLIHKFRIKKNGIIIADDQWNEGYTDVVGSRFKSAIYSVEIKIEGLGISPAIQIVISK